MKGIATTEVNSTAARASEVTSRALGAQGVVWVAERDACVNCTALAGQVARPGQSFDGSLTWGDQPIQWSGFNGRPPRHRSEERRVGKEGVRMCRYRWSRAP